MKSFNLSCCLILFVTLATAQKDNSSLQVPSEVTASLRKMFPEAASPEWTQKKEKFKAEFKVGKTKHEVWMDKAGAVSKHQYEIKKAELPIPVTETISKDFSTYTIDDCSRTDANGVTTYKVELKSPAGKKKVRFGSNGKVIVKEED